MKKNISKTSAIIVATVLSFLLCFPMVKTNVFALEDVVAEKVYSSATMNDQFSDDTVLVVLNERASYSAKNYTTNDFSAFGCSKIQDLTQEATRVVQQNNPQGRAFLNTENVISTNELVNVENYKRVLSLKLGTKSKQNVLNVIKELEKRNDVYYAGPDYKIAAQSTTNDSLAVGQWALDLLDLPECWDYVSGSSDVVVGVIDSGIEGMHEDLSGRINVSLSRDFTSGSAVAVTAVTDPYGHGTAVSGVIGAISNNSLGVAGVCPKVTLASLRVLDEDGYGFMSRIGAAIEFAQANNIPILNCSVAWVMSSTGYDQAIYNVIQTYNGLLVCAASNSSANNDITTTAAYPASYDLNNIISVGALDTSFDRWEKSNYGANSVDIYAPGVNIVTTSKNNLYNLWSGTSFSAPYVAGVAALLKSVKNGISTSTIKTAILEGSTPWLITLPDESQQLTKRLNAFESLKRAISLSMTKTALLENNGYANKTINAQSDYYLEKTFLHRLIFVSTFDYHIAVYADHAVDVTLYDADYDEITITKTIINSGKMVEFTKSLEAGTYFIRIDFENSNLGGKIKCNVDGPLHTHSYTGWVYNDRSGHVQQCSCGATNGTYASHRVDSNSTGSLRTCRYCGAIMRTDDIIIYPDSLQELLNV